MAKVDFKPRSQGFVDIMNSSGCQSMLLAKAQAIAAGATAKSTYKHTEFTADVKPGKTRAHARAKSTSRGAYWSAVKEGSLAASIGEGR